LALLQVEPLRTGSKHRSFARKKVFSRREHYPRAKPYSSALFASIARDIVGLPSVSNVGLEKFHFMTAASSCREGYLLAYK
jgi:hypothetical protein